MLSGFKASVQNELNSFFATLANQTDMLRQVSVQAFSQARKKLSYRVFADINTRLLDLVQAHMHVPLWHGLRVVAADASIMQRFLQDATGRSVRETIAFALYLPSQEMTLAASMNLQWLRGKCCSSIRSAWLQTTCWSWIVAIHRDGWLRFSRSAAFRSASVLMPPAFLRSNPFCTPARPKPWSLCVRPIQRSARITNVPPRPPRCARSVWSPRRPHSRGHYLVDGCFGVPRSLLRGPVP